MSVARIVVRPGERGPFLVDDEHADGSGGVALLYGDVTPDVVYPPAEVGGGERRVLRIFQARCPLHPHSVRHFDLGEDLGAAECLDAGFLWYQPPPRTAP